MKSFKHLALTTVAVLSICQAAAAQQVYRCGNSYSQTPCTGAIAINTDDARTPEQRAEAKQALASDKALAKELEASRRKDEARALAADKQALAQAAARHKKLEKPVAVKKPAVANKRKATIQEPDNGVFTAVSGGPKKKTGKP